MSSNSSSSTLTAHKPMDYSKWDVLDEEEEEKKPYNLAAAQHQESLTVISQWIREASPKIKSSELRRLLDFITVQHRGVQPHNVRRAAEICAFIERAGPNEQPDIEKLLALTKKAMEASNQEDPAEKQRGVRVLSVALGAMNTLAAINEVGNPRWLFDMLHKDPDGEVMKKYKDFGYGMEVLHAPPVDPYERDLPHDLSSWCRRLWKAVALQMIVAIVVCIPMALLFFFFGPDMETMEANMLSGMGLEKPPMQQADSQAWDAPDPVGGHQEL